MSLPKMTPEFISEMFNKLQSVVRNELLLEGKDLKNTSLESSIRFNAFREQAGESAVSLGKLVEQEIQRIRNYIEFVGKSRDADLKNHFFCQKRLKLLFLLLTTLFLNKEIFWKKKPKKLLQSLGKKKLKIFWLRLDWKSEPRL